MEHGHAPSSGTVHLRLALAWLALAWERLWVRLWLPAALAGLFLAVALTDTLAALSPAPHVVVVVLAAAALAAVTWRRVKGFIPPSRHEARARLEAESPVGHRPLTAVEDSLAALSGEGSGEAGGDAIRQALWEAHQRRAREDLARLRAPAPAPNVAARDHYAFRGVVILALFIALVGGSGTIPARLLRNIVPSMVKAGPAVAIKMWITPPAYTGRSPTYVEIPSADGRDPPKTLEIADGSTGLFVITGAPTNIGVAMDKKLTPLERLADASQHGEFPLKPAERLEIMQGSKAVAGWDVTWIPDKPPVIAFTGPAATASRWRLKFDYKASDDYGVQTVVAHMVRPDAPNAQNPPLDVGLSLPPFASKVITQSPALDLAAHPWAGQKVKLSLKATDQAGQTTESDVIDATLPERVFTHPVAKEIIAQRKALFTDAQANAPAALASVTQITRKPESFGGDPLTHLALAAARYRLQAEPPAEAMKTVPDLLWHAAVRMEDGNLTIAEQRLANAEQALRDAIEKGAAQDEINSKIAELQQALADYQKAKTQKQENNFAANQGTPPDIQKMMEQLKQMNDMGAKEGAKQQLSALQEMLQEMRDENMDLENESAPAKAAQKLLSDMQDLTKSQADLVNKNFERSRAEELRRQQRQAQNQQGNQGNQQQRPNGNRSDDSSMQGGADAATQQEALRQELARINDQVRQMTGKPQAALDEAGEAMGEARDHLKAGSWKNGVEAQSRALSKLQESAEQTQQDLAEAMFNKGFGGMMEQPGAPQFRFGQGQRGRAGGNNNDVDVPMGDDPASMASRVRAILDEIRSRASDRTRPAEEQDYLKRLMKQF